MSDASLKTDSYALAGPRDYYDLLKPRVMSLVIFTAFVGMVAAPGTLHPALAAISLLSIAVGAGASGVVAVAGGVSTGAVAGGVTAVVAPPSAGSGC